MKNGLIEGPANKKTQRHKKTQSLTLPNKSRGLSILDKELSERFAMASS